MRSLVFTLFFSFLFGKAISQAITIFGPTTVQPGDVAYYQAQFSYYPNPYSLMYWTVQGGTILFQNVNPTGLVDVTIQWDYTPGIGYITLYDDLQSETGYLTVNIGAPVDPGFINTSSNLFNQFSPPSVSEFPASGGTCSTYNYTWEKSTDNVNWVSIGTGQTYPTNVPLFNATTYVRRVVECNGTVVYSNVLQFDYRSANWENRNYIRTNEVSYAGKTTFVDVDVLPIGQKQQSTVFYDGLGRPEQSLSMGVTVNNKDLITPIVYDGLGREAQKYLSYESPNGDGKFRTSIITEQNNFYGNATTGKHPGEAPFYSQTQFEESPLNRINKILAPGSNWGGAGVGILSTYHLNTKNGDAVRIWRIDAFDPNAVPVSGVNDIYEDNTLYKSTITDERGKQVLEYKDIDGKVILKKQQLENQAPLLGTSHDGWLCTYYVYDDFDRLRFVISPKAVEKMRSTTWVITNALANGLCYKYIYDHERRVIEKKLPDADPVYLVYDNRDRLVLSQDGNQRAGKTNQYNYKEWSFFVYDDQNRQLISGSILDHIANYTRGQMQAIVDNPGYSTANVTINYQTNISETQVAFNPIPIFWTNNPPIQHYEKRINTVNYYDQANAGNYQNVTVPYASNFDNIDAQTPSNRTRGMLTSSKVRVLNNTLNTFTTTTAIFDEKARQIQTSHNGFLAIPSLTTNQYDFSNKLRANVYEQTKTEVVVSNPYNLTNTEAYTIITKNEFNHAGRLLRVKKNVTNSYYAALPLDGVPNPRVLTTGERTIVENTYDELGNLVSKKLAPGYNNPNGNSYMEKQDYSYNIRGWTTGINKAYVQNSSSAGTFFGMEIEYDKPGNAGFVNTILNGNIAGVSWKTAGDNVPRKYDYFYDNSNRLMIADFNQRNSFGTTNWTKDKFDFTLSGMQYDFNGNIRHMEQKGVDFSGIRQMDKLDYKYDDYSNKLDWVAEDPSINSTDYKLGDFTDRNTGINNIDYSYDNNGNLTLDNNKSISSIKYSFLNLPQTIDIHTNSKVEYIYDAAGNKLQKIVTDNTGTTGTVTITTTYSGPIVYAPGGSFMNFEEGRIRFNRNIDGLVFDYFIRDYLGSVRMVLTEETGSLPYPMATMETASATLEDKYYVITNREDKPAALLGNPPNTQQQYDQRYGQKMSKLSSLGAGNKVGPSILLKVMAGDQVSAKTDYYYQSDGTQVNSNSLLQDLALNLLIHLNAGQAGSTAKGQSNNISSSVQGNDLISGSNGLINQQNNTFNSNKPKAFINYVVFDEQFNVVDKGFKQVENFGPLQPPITRNDIPIAKNGWIYVFCNNESQQPVYFDNFQVIHTRGNILEEDHYYPFGLVMQGISSKALSFGNPSNKLKYNGKEEQRQEFSDGSGLEWLDFGARIYDNQIGRWMVIDPLASEFPWQSPYCAMDNDPINKIDPRGMSASPVYNQEGTLLGTDDQGLKGKAIVMDKANFQQGMKHDDALKNNLGTAGLKDDAAKLNLATSYNSLSSRPDYDGKLTLSEANEWYRTGGGKPLFVDASKIDLTPKYKDDFKVGESKYVNYASPSNANMGTGLVYGTIKLTMTDANGTVKLGGAGGLLDKYDFDYQKGRTGRNIATWLGKTVAGSGTGYNIFNYGTGLLLQRPAPIKLERGPKF